MLNSDLCLLLDIFNETSGGTSPPPGRGIGGVAPGTPTKPLCTYDTCRDSPAAPAVRAYGANNTLFMTDFVAVWVKMVTKGYDVCDLSAMVSDASLPEEVYGIDEITAGCVPEFSGPVTTGVLGPAPPALGDGGVDMLAPEEAAVGPAEGPAQGPVEGPALGPAEEPTEGPADGPAEGPAEGPEQVALGEDPETALAEDVVTEEAAEGQAVAGEELSWAACMRGGAAAGLVAALLGVVM